MPGESRHSFFSNRAFSLIEVLVSVSIVALLTLGIAGGICFCLKSIRSNMEWNRSTQLLMREYEKLGLLSWDDIVSTNFSTNFSGVLYPEWGLPASLVGTNSVFDIISTNLTNVILGYDLVATNKDNLEDTNFVVKEVTFDELRDFTIEDPEPLEPTNTVISTNTNTVFFGTITLYPVTNDQVVFEKLRKAVLQTVWYSDGRIRTNKLETILTPENITHFWQNPVVQPPALNYTNIKAYLNNLNSNLLYRETEHEFVW